MKLTLSILALIATSFPSYGYVGPGAGLSVLGTVIAFLGAIILMTLGLFWYPLKRLYKKIKGADKTESELKKDET